VCSRVTRTDPALQDTGSAYGWPRQLFGFAAVRGATTPAHLRPQGTAGRTAYRAYVQDVTALSYTTFEIQGMSVNSRVGLTAIGHRTPASAKSTRKAQLARV